MFNDIILNLPSFYICLSNVSNVYYFLLKSIISINSYLLCCAVSLKLHIFRFELIRICLESDKLYWTQKSGPRVPRTTHLLNEELSSSAPSKIKYCCFARFRENYFSQNYFSFPDYIFDQVHPQSSENYLPGEGGRGLSQQP